MMGIVRADYIIIGANIGYDKYDEDRYEEYDEYNGRNKEGEMTYIIDGMSGQYFVVGEVVTHGDEYEGFGVHELTINDKSAERVAEFIREKFGIDVKPTLMVVTDFY